ncbi:hypothetical protein BJ138DRAFT_172412 [Hygrophoropsis aurantiaca]|uniref:Uncharacterized protein n=1 Tax=Hygrophoropsis aurantiaca TaxID=72124 RepID=A0ACB8APS6_9AGAM|nr:hypothetical protein BJ138DRAFT_172412 [Hygrophoropsis aurantiaca]
MFNRAEQPYVFATLTGARPSQPHVFTILRVITTILQLFGMSLTLFRLWHRVSIRRFWWEDWWAALASFCGALCLISDWVHVTTSIPKVSSISCWVYFFSFACTVWAVRMSLLFSVARLIYPEKNARRILMGGSIVFALLWGSIIFERAYICGSDLSWYNSPSRSCTLPASMDIYELVADVISDTILVILPLRLLWHIKLPTKSQRRMILCIFSSTIIISLASLFRAVNRLSRANFLVLTASELEVAFCLIVCNLLVAVTYFYRIFKRDHENGPSSVESDDYDYPIPTQYLTTIDLGALESDVSEMSEPTSISERKTLPPIQPHPCNRVPRI